MNVAASIQTVYVRGILLYQLYDLQHAAWYPLRLMAEATQTAFQNPFLPASYTRVGRTIAAGAELVERTTRRFAKPEFGLAATKVDGEEVAVREVPGGLASHSAIWSISNARPTRYIRRFWLSRPCRATTPRCCAARSRRCCPSTTSTSPTGSTRARCRWPRGTFDLDDYITT